jgi:drug/metabolite transporter (DMT)-like permease
MASAGSIVFLGDRNLISGNLRSLPVILKILVNWKFLLSMALALLARVSFVFLNNILMNDSKLAQASTTLTTFITLLSIVFIVAANYFFLHEKLSTQQIFGAIIILGGVALMMK